MIMREICPEFIQAYRLELKSETLASYIFGFIYFLRYTFAKLDRDFDNRMLFKCNIIFHVS